MVLSERGVAGYAALLPGLGLSSHVGELRLVVARSARRQGLGRLLAGTALRAALFAGLSKIVVEVPAEQEGTAEVFRRLGFEGEALLRDHLRDRDGRLRDLLVLAHFAERPPRPCPASASTSRTRRDPAGSVAHRPHA